MSRYFLILHRYLTYLFACLAVACTGGEGDDLDQFIRNADNDLQIKVKPLPDVKTYLSFEFNADGSLSDPFKSRKASSKAGLLQPNFDRPKEPMESYPFESLKYVGMLEKSKLTFALLKTPDNGVQQVKIGSYVGQNFGKVIEIKDSEVVINEVVQDEASGDWVERVSVLTLQE